MKKLEKLEKYVIIPNTRFYGGYIFDGEDIVILDVIIEGLQEKYVSDETQLYFKNGMQALQIKRRRTLDSLPKNEDSCQRKYTFWKCILR